MEFRIVKGNPSYWIAIYLEHLTDFFDIQKITNVIWDNIIENVKIKHRVFEVRRKDFRMDVNIIIPFEEIQNNYYLEVEAEIHNIVRNVLEKINQASRILEEIDDETIVSVNE